MADNKLKVGGSEITDIYYGETPVQKVYYGESLVWSRKPKIASFGGIVFTPGPLIYQDGLTVLDSWNSYTEIKNSLDKSLLDNENGATYFSLSYMGSVFDSRGEAWTTDLMTQTSAGTYKLQTGPTISYGGYDWRMITKTEAQLLTGSAVDENYNTITREGSTVNGTAGAFWTNIYIKDTTPGETYQRGGLLLFPDGFTMTGVSLSYINKTVGAPQGLTIAEIENYISQGCVFLPAWGYFYQESSSTSYSSSWGIPYYKGSMSDVIFSDTIDIGVGGFYSGNPCSYCINTGPLINNSPYKDDAYIGLGGSSNYREYFAPQWLVRTV